MCINAHFYDDIKYYYAAFSQYPRVAEYHAGFFVLIHEHRDHYESVYGQLQRLEANLDDVFWMSNPEEVLATKNVNCINRVGLLIVIIACFH